MNDSSGRDKKTDIGNGSATNEELRERTLAILDVLEEQFPDARTLLRFENPFQLLVATILAAQCTDERVNQVTEDLFRKLPDPKTMSEATPEDLEQMIRPTGFYRNKTKSLLKASSTLVESFAGEVPRSIEELITIPGVGRKTANVIVGNCFGQPAVIVDTHLKRVVGRLGLTQQRDPDKIEMEMREILPPSRQTRFSMLINFHGRYRCKARKPDCPGCPIARLCPYHKKTQG
jgi:endonuclease-3